MRIASALSLPLAMAAVLLCACGGGSPGDDAAADIFPADVTADLPPDTAAPDAPTDTHFDAPDLAALDARDITEISDITADLLPGLDAPPDAPADVPALDSVDAPAPPDVTDAPPDAPTPLTMSIACIDTIPNVYVTPTTLPAFDPTQRGVIFRCAVDSSMDTAMVQSTLNTKGVVGVTATSGVNIFRVAYRTTRAATNGAGASTARLYVPTNPLSVPLPVVVIAHGTTGLAATCAPSMDPTSQEDLALPWAALGYAVIAPDYAGLGNGGTQGYIDNRDTGYSTLDGARALRNLFQPGTFDTRVVFSGHSQGGGAVLSAQALAQTYGCGGTPAAIVVFAAEYETRLNSFDLINALSSQSSLTISFGITTPVVATLEAYAWYENYVGTGTGGMAFPSASSASIVNAAQTQCLVAYGAIQQGVQFLVSDWYAPAFISSFLACVGAAGDAGAPACSGNGQAFYNFLGNNILTGDPNGAPVLYLQGLSDIVMPPAQEAACNVNKLRTDGVQVQACTDASASHTSVITSDVAFGIEWTQAVLAGTTPPACAASALPTCTP